jgi:hypothetical protein
MCFLSLYLKINQVQTPSINDLVFNFQRDADGECVSSLSLFVPDKISKNAKELMTLLTSRAELFPGTESDETESDHDFNPEAAEKEAASGDESGSAGGEEEGEKGNAGGDDNDNDED